MRGAPGLLITGRQINYILDLLKRRGYPTDYCGPAHEGLPGAHPWNTSGTVGDWVCGLTRKSASRLIETLEGGGR